ncbi:MAG: hypothetical protein ACOX23_04535 [Peptococcia bacterium]|jgi:hypothetical protein
MRHYRREELQQYKNGLSGMSGEGFKDDRNTDIESHLASCVQCQEKFLTLVSAEEVSCAAELLSPDFTDKVLARVAKERSRQHSGQQRMSQKTGSYQPNQSREKWQSMVLYYVGAAVITLVFVSNGLFQRIIDVKPPMSFISSVERMKMVEAGEKEMGLDLPRKAVEEAAQWIDNFEMPKGREGEVR